MAKKFEFDFKRYIRDLIDGGWWRGAEHQESLTKPRKYQKGKWNPRAYLQDVFFSIINGGFSYFTYISSREQSKERTPMLLADEKLQKIDEVRSNWSGWGDVCGPLYFTGRRFILDTKRIRFRDLSNDALISHPLSSYWIEPDFSDLYELLDVEYFREEGTFRKKRFNMLVFTATMINRKLQCGYLMDGPNGSKYMNDVYLLYWSYSQRRALKKLTQEIQNLIEEAKNTLVSELIMHTYKCHLTVDVMTEPNIARAQHYGWSKRNE